MADDKQNQDEQLGDQNQKSEQKDVNSAENEKKSVHFNAAEDRTKHKQKLERDELKGEVPDDAPKSAPINPFEQPLPNSQKEDEAPENEEVDDDEEEEDDEVENDAPINPFAPPPSKADSSMDSKALDSKPLDDAEVTVVNPFESSFEKAKDTPADAENSDSNDKSDVPSSEVEVVDIPHKETPPSIDEIKTNLNDDHEDLGSEVWDILEQAGITKKKLLIFLAVFVIVVVVIFGFVFNWFSLPSFDFSKDEPKTVEEVDTPSDEPISPAFPVISSYIFGLEYALPANNIVAIPINNFGTDNGIESNLVFGLDEVLPGGVFSQYVNVVSELKNVYNTDIYAYLDKSTNRQARLDEFIKEMASLNEKGLAIYEQLGNDIDVLNINLTSLAAERDLHEVEFFRILNQLEGNASVVEFENFLVFENKVQRIKARLGAYQALRSMYKVLLEATVPRLEDIKANKEALVKGIRVFDIQGSDINAILPLQLEFPN